MQFKSLLMLPLFFLAGAVQNTVPIEGKYVVDLKALRGEMIEHHWFNLGVQQMSKEDEDTILDAFCQMAATVSLEIRSDGTYVIHSTGGDYGGTYVTTKTGIASSSPMLTATADGVRRMKLGTFSLFRGDNGLHFVDDADRKFSLPIKHVDNKAQ